jgi:hypothetical protein
MIVYRPSTELVKPNVIKLIRVNKCYKFWNNEITRAKYFYSIIDDKTNIYSFLNDEAANNCLQFLEKYKKINLRYPNQEIPSSYIQKELIIDEEPLASMQERCSLAGIGLLGISQFNYRCYLNYFDTEYAAVDLLENVKVKESRRVDYLNYLYDSDLNNHA